jgi:hypothetical protein
MVYMIVPTASRDNNKAAQDERSARAKATRKAEIAAREAVEREAAERQAEYDRLAPKRAAEAARRDAEIEALLSARRAVARRKLEDRIKMANADLTLFNAVTPDQQALCGHPHGDLDGQLRQLRTQYQQLNREV